MPRWKSVFATWAIALGICASAAAGDPKGFEDVFKGVEKGKRFHPLWPPVAHRSIVGSAVSAQNASEIMATWESIESPTFLDPGAQFRFELGAVAYSAPELTQTRTIDVTLGFAELDALAALAHAATPGTAASGTETKQTGVTTKDDVGAGFFAKLTAWLPTVDVRYVNSRTVRLVANHPVYIGYKLWRPGADVAGTRGRGEDDQDVHSLGIDATEIDRLVQAARTAKQ